MAAIGLAFEDHQGNANGSRLDSPLMGGTERRGALWQDRLVAARRLVSVVGC